MNTRNKILLAAAGLVLLAGFLFALPPIRERVIWHLDQWRIRAFYLLNPPEDVVFTPGQKDQVAEIVQATAQALSLSTPGDISCSACAAQTLTPTAPADAAAATATPPPDQPTFTPAPPTATPTPLPASASVASVPYVDQHYGFNNCAPANLTMALQFWGWPGKREDVSVYVKPFDKDKNVMPYELADYVNTQTNFKAVERYGGTPDLLKSLVAAGYPVIVERGVHLLDLSGKVSWMGHYQVVYGYNDAAQKYQVKDSFEQNGANFQVNYDEMLSGWRSFNYAFLVVYPPDQEAAVSSLLGPYWDESAADKIAYETASNEIYTTEGQDQFFAWFNRGSSLVRLQDFGGAAKAYDEAFALYATLPANDRPWRAVWYMTGPYFAYYYSGRYYDVISLADQTISAASEPYIEELFYWRAMAKATLGDNGGAVTDLRKSLDYHPAFGPSLAELQTLGATP